MKKIVLGCAVVLLSIGLLSGCHTENAVNPDDIEPDQESFATDSWETINYHCTKGEASDYYEIGDTKTITINGKSHDIRIIDFDHDTLTTNDINYNYNKGKAAITCEMVDCLPNYKQMNSSGTNWGGWYSSGMRSWLNSSILSTLDSDLQSVIKKVDKKSTAGNSSTSLGTTASDSLFLLARVELDGTTNPGYVDEGTIYEYWRKHNSNDDRIKCENNLKCQWWIRSPYANSRNIFHYINFEGRIGEGASAEFQFFVSFAFCI